MLGFKTPLSFAIHTLGATAVHLVASLPSQIADNLPMYTIFVIN